MIDWEAFKRQIQANPKKMLGFVLAIAVCFLVIWMLVAVQVDPAGETVAVEQSGRLDSLRISLSEATGDSLTIKDEQSVSVTTSEKSSSPFSNALPTFLIMLSVIGALWYWIKKNNDAEQQVSADVNLFDLLGSQQVAPGQQIAVIKINNEFWVLGTGGEVVQLLHRYSEDEWEGPESPVRKEKGSASKLFANILKNEQVKKAPGKNGSQ